VKSWLLPEPVKASREKPGNRRPHALRSARSGGCLSAVELPPSETAGPAIDPAIDDDRASQTGWQASIKPCLSASLV
jgi:hypothetical protein